MKNQQLHIAITGANGFVARNLRRILYEKKIPMRGWVKKNPDSALAVAVNLWGYGPRFVY